MTDVGATETADRHASWLELFFDLVVVVAVAQLAHRLLHPTWADVALFVMLYYAIWSIWTSFTIYANVRADKTRTRAMLIGMFGIAVMAAAAPDVAHAVPGGGNHDNWFAAAYVVCRLSGSRSIQSSGAVLTSWPAAQFGAGLAPWIMSFWAVAPVTYWLWALGILLDLIFTLQHARHPEQLVQALKAQAGRLKERALRRGVAGRRPSREIPAPYEAVLHSAHLGERLGLFVIIVLGEAVMQIVVDASGQNWGAPLKLAAAGAFALVVCLWWVTLQYGVTAVPEASERGLPAFVALPAHFVMTAGLVAAAAGLGAAVAHPAAHLHPGIRWVLCAGLAVYFAASAVIGVATGARRLWLWAWALPATAVPVLLGLLGGPLPAWAVVAVLLVAALWRVAYRPPATAPSPA
ncbi:low temperature requirement protein A [Nonomuraea endophytica]|uniref:Low temperature requirement protein LtrA n=1 Tax=Nonomuraea endophytica TaxID=714136 RepID=A0A7W8EGX7_9ACTN|nr:low temperature requirement protein A [Nonomuraea endophytica]MBB5078881.1 low temperature requirement protein LtrA [Nonomuraea endophytica]